MAVSVPARICCSIRRRYHRCNSAPKLDPFRFAKEAFLVVTMIRYENIKHCIFCRRKANGSTNQKQYPRPQLHHQFSVERSVVTRIFCSSLRDSVKNSHRHSVSGSSYFVRNSCTSLYVSISVSLSPSVKFIHRFSSITGQIRSAEE